MMLSDRRGIVWMPIWNWILGWLSWHVLGQVQPDCDFRYYLQYGQQQILQNPGFEQGMYYDPGKICRWSYSGPAGSAFDLSCNPIDMPVSSQCQQDRLVVSLTGNPTLSDGRNYCGVGTLKLTSVSNALTIGLVTSSNSNGGRYRCVITPMSGQGGQVPTTPPTTATSTPSSSKCDCGWKQQRRIVGGTETKVNEYAFMAALIDVDKQTVWCGAAIISDRYALTAAHCVVQTSYTRFGLLVGDHNIRQGNETGSARLYRLSDYYVHELYNAQTKQNDIAIVRTDTVIAFSMAVGPVCLPYRYTDVDFTGATVTTMGWGSLFFSGPTSGSLQHVNLTVIDQNSCQQQYTSETIYPTELCTFRKDKDACSFDSGGPVVWFDTFNTFRYQLLALISFGKDCATDAPGVNVRVTSYMSWILNETPDASYCMV